jgi:hypothetical protein
MNMIVGTAAMSAIAGKISAAPASSPVNAAIEAHKAAWAAYGVEVDVTTRLETALPKDRGQSDPRWIAHKRALGALNSAYDDASIALLNLEPATLADLLELVSYIADLERRGLESWPDVEDEDMGPTTWDKCLLCLIEDTLGRIAGTA